MNRLAIAILAVALSACTPTGQLTPQAQQSIADLCAKDATLQPQAADIAGTAAALAPLAGPQAAAAGGAVSGAVALDTAVLHPAVQDVCKQVAPVIPPTATGAALNGQRS